jgi:hypothetical protein
MERKYFAKEFCENGFKIFMKIDFTGKTYWKEVALMKGTPSKASSKPQKVVMVGGDKKIYEGYSAGDCISQMHGIKQNEPIVVDYEYRKEKK